MRHAKRHRPAARFGARQSDGPLNDGAYGQDGKFIQNEAKLWNRMSTTQIADHGLIEFCIIDKFKLEKKILV
jgi:hypothetical protein